MTLHQAPVLQQRGPRALHVEACARGSVCAWKCAPALLGCVCGGRPKTSVSSNLPQITLTLMLLLRLTQLAFPNHVPLLDPRLPDSHLLAAGTGQA